MTRKEEGFPGYTSGFIEAVWRELQAIHRFSTYVFIKKNFETDLYWDSFVSPFVSDLWGALAATALLIVGCLLLDWALLRGYTRQLPLKESLYFVLACFLMQGQTPHSRLGSMCTIYVTAYSIASVMFSAYSAALVSILAVQTDVLPFTTFQGLLDDGTYKLGVLEGSAQISYLDRTEDSTLRKVYEKLIAPQLSNMPSNVSVGLQRVCHNNKKYAFMVELANVWGLVRNLPCHVVRVPGTEIPSVISIVLPKNFTYQHLLRQTVLQMRSAGILQRLHRMNIPAEKEMNDVHEVHLSLNSFLILLTLLGADIEVKIIN
ncbi:hypothetical protein C0J52_00639 [Blattella germanica]|nr:hypothetical protein C0J52_00639 [Blattella germanica]